MRTDKSPREINAIEKGFQYGNAGEMITWKWLQCIFFFFFWGGGNELVCPMGLTTHIIWKGNSTERRMKFKFLLI